MAYDHWEGQGGFQTPAPDTRSKITTKQGLEIGYQIVDWIWGKTAKAKKQQAALQAATNRQRKALLRQMQAANRTATAKSIRSTSTTLGKTQTGLDSDKGSIMEMLQRTDTQIALGVALVAVVFVASRR